MLQLSYTDQMVTNLYGGAETVTKGSEFREKLINVSTTYTTSVRNTKINTSSIFQVKCNEIRHNGSLETPAIVAVPLTFFIEPML